MAKKQQAETSEQDPGASLVQMVNQWAEEGQPATADVHPDEVENFAAAGWTVKE